VDSRYDDPVPKPRRVPTWAEVAVSRVGMRKTLHVFQFAMGWGLATASLGREPESVEEYAEHMEISRAKAFRDQQEWREAFPTELTPYHFNDVSGAQARYDEAWRRLKDLKKVKAEVQPLLFSIGGSPA
jgi:hypothetical protein